MINPMSLEGKHVLITGASGGIGSQTAKLAHALGARVCLVARNEEKLVALAESFGNEVTYYCQDLSQLGEIEPLVERIVRENGTFDGLVNCMGIGINRPIKMVKPDFLEEIMYTNFFPFVELVRVITKKKYSNDGISIIGISSVAAQKGNKAQGAYAASKAAIDGIIRPMAKEFAYRGIRVNSATFGMVRTDMYKSFQEAGGTDEELKDQYLGIGEAQDAANVLCFLLSDASRFITGSTIVADGGYLS